MSKSRLWIWVLFSIFVTTATVVHGEEAKKVPAPKAENAQAVDPYFQTVDRPFAFSIELLGRGLLYSLNIDYSVIPNLALGAGISYLPGTSASALVIPFFANFYPITGENRIFITAGVDYFSASESVFLT